MKLSLYKSSILLIAVISSLFVLEGKAIAQAAEVPNPDINGEFRTAFQQGNRGYYTIKKWLVVQPMRSGDYDLNCRYTPNGQIRSRILRGAILTAVFQGTANKRSENLPDPATDAIAFDSDGSPWLRVKGSQDELAYPVRPLTFGNLGECYVRANLKYIAPINPDAIATNNIKQINPTK
ncbi:MAG: hypothetical protein WCP16_21705 [Pseudanabaena sp. ELA645]|jgi:hypothetical protein